MERSRAWPAVTVAVLAAVLTWAALASAASAKTVWLCKPGQSPDPCTPGLSTTVYSPTLQPLRTTHPKAAKKPAFDCFYVYPTVSDQSTTLANRHVDPEERSIALYQAARYSQVCRVYAPMYRQVTVPARDAGTAETPAQLKTPVGDVEAAFKSYLKNDNDGRPFVLIGHSQGSFVLEQLISHLIDNNAQLRSQMLSAILMGGNVLVKKGTGVGGTFKHVRACRSDTQLGCVIAFSSFDQPVPADSLFGRSPVAGDRVLCTNPAALGGGSAVVDPIFPSAPFAPGTLIAAGISLLGITQPHPTTVWTEEPGAYSAQCISSQGASVLQVAPLGGAQTPVPSPDPTWGLHLLDANVELGNLLSVVRHEAAAYVPPTARVQ
jgi:Protein of unknown function (DUF3089)